MKAKELEERLIHFGVMIIDIVNEMPASKAGAHLSGQLLRSGTSGALNYGEAQSGESRKDFVHKISIVLKELRETMVNLKMIYQAGLHLSDDKIIKALKENDELISIFVSSIKTAIANQNR